MSTLTWEAGVLVVTTNDVPGHDVKQVIGEVIGLTVRTRRLGARIGAGMKSVIGGEPRGLTKTLVQARTARSDRWSPRPPPRSSPCPASARKPPGSC
ncbi:heavy metal-binding domain-containing protein [Streptomyces canarius]|uniref:Uncharacterized protein n=1 Tax=Streptomyces canarius TaxID=285453 RepID=A0ABQ3DCV0_9ACTN|nr:hypothetical protein GCM10010345_92510 [Streptomyces canarius]